MISRTLLPTFSLVADLGDVLREGTLVGKSRHAAIFYRYKRLISMWSYREYFYLRLNPNHKK